MSDVAVAVLLAGLTTCVTVLMLDRSAARTGDYRAPRQRQRARTPGASPS